MSDETIEAPMVRIDEAWIEIEGAYLLTCERDGFTRVEEAFVGRARAEARLAEAEQGRSARTRYALVYVPLEDVEAS